MFTDLPDGRRVLCEVMAETTVDLYVDETRRDDRPFGVDDHFVNWLFDDETAGEVEICFDEASLDE